MAGLFGSGPQSNILNTVQGSYTAMLNAEKQKGQAAHQAMGAFGEAISPKAIGMTNFKNDFKDADWSKPETYARAGQQLMSFDPSAGLSMIDKGRSLAASMAYKSDMQWVDQVDPVTGITSKVAVDMNTVQAGDAVVTELPEVIDFKYAAPKEFTNPSSNIKEWKQQQEDGSWKTIGMAGNQPDLKDADPLQAPFWDGKLQRNVIKTYDRVSKEWLYAGDAPRKDDLKRSIVTLLEGGSNVVYSVSSSDPTDKIKVGVAKDTGPNTVVNIGVNETDKALAKANVASLEELGSSDEFRKGNITTAKKFLAGFRDGSINSGAGRKLASYVPMSFTEQSQLDEQLDSMSEQAARAKLKSLGEIRPTDADVKGMKESLFGIGRSEETNIVLLEQYVKELEQSEAKYQGLLNARAQGRLGSFVLDTSSGLVSSAETDSSVISNMFTGVDPSSDLYERLYEGLTDTQKIIYGNTLKGL